MSKPSKMKKDSKYQFLNSCTFEFSDYGCWLIDNQPVLNFWQSIHMNLPYDINILRKYYNVSECLMNIFKSETYWCDGIFRSWMEMLMIYLDSAIYCHTYKITEGNEKAKEKAASAKSQKFCSLYA